MKKDVILLLDILAEERDVTRSQMVRDLIHIGLLLFDPSTKNKDVLREFDLDPEKPFGEATKNMQRFLRNKGYR